MKSLTIFLALTALFCASAYAINFYSPIQLCSSVVADRCFDGYLWNLDTPGSGSNETMLRMEILVNPLDSTQREVIVRRINRVVPGNRTVSSQLQFQVPFIAELGSPFDCCIHEALGVTNTSVPSTVNATFDIPRKDGFTIVVISGPIDTSLNETQLTSIILDSTSSTATWDMVNTVCPVTCAVQSNYVVVLDDSGSIIDSEFGNYGEFMDRFFDRVPIGPNSANIGIVMFSGGSVGSNDIYCVMDAPPVVFNSTGGGARLSTQALALWAQALGDPDWYLNCDWPALSTGNGQYMNGKNNLFCLNQANLTTKISGCGNGGEALAALYITDNAELASDVVDSLKVPYRPFDDCTGTGTGIHMALDLYERAAIFRPTVPEIMIIMTDGVSNIGENPVLMSDIARSFGIQVFSVGIGSGQDANQLLQIAGNDSSRYFSISGFNDFDNLLEPLITTACLGESGTGAICPNCPSGSLCTTCSQCVTCLSDSDCNPCQRCNLNTRACNDIAVSAACPFDAPTTCDEWICDTTAGCQLTRNTDAENQFIESCNATDGGVWNATSCTCEVDINTGDGGTPVGPIVGATVGGAAVAAAATLATLVGGVAVCGLLGLALIAALIAALIVLAVLAVGLLILLIVGGLGVAALVMGIKMAIPPAIKGLEIANPADITAMENPLAKGAEWVGSKLEN